MGIRARIFLSLVFLPLCAWAAEDRREAIIVVDQPCVVEELASELPEAADRPHRIHERILSSDGAARAARLRARKTQVAGAIGKTGAEIIGQTEIVLNSVLVRATEQQLAAIRNIAGVVSAQWAPEYELLLDAAAPLLQVPQAWQALATAGFPNPGQGVKVGIIDSGIDHTHPMFQASGMTMPAGFPRYWPLTSTPPIRTPR